jgi:hypothetical protein
VWPFGRWWKPTPFFLPGVVEVILEESESSAQRPVRTDTLKVQAIINKLFPTHPYSQEGALLSDFELSGCYLPRQTNEMQGDDRGTLMVLALFSPSWFSFRIPKMG